MSTSERSSIAKDLVTAAAAPASTERPGLVDKLYAAAGAADSTVLLTIPIEQIVPASQNRRTIHPESLRDLADSIRVSGLVEPIVVKFLPDPDGGFSTEDRYQLIAGERRWRAAQLAGLTSINAIVRKEEKTKGLQLAENRFRENLLPFDEAETIQATMTEEGLSVDAFAAKYRYTTSVVYKLLALLADDVTGAPAFLRDASEAGVLVSEGEGTRRKRAVPERAAIFQMHIYYRARLKGVRHQNRGKDPTPKQVEIAQAKTRELLEKVLAEGWSTRALEAFVAKYAQQVRRGKGSAAPTPDTSSEPVTPEGEGAPPTAAPAIESVAERAAKAIRPLYEEDKRRKRFTLFLDRLTDPRYQLPETLEQTARELERLAKVARDLAATASARASVADDAPSTIAG